MTADRRIQGRFVGAIRLLARPGRHRQYRPLAAWWTNTRQQLPATIQQLLDGHDHEVLAALARHRDDPVRRRAVRLALRSDWQHPQAGRPSARIIYGTAPADPTAGPDLTGNTARRQHCRQR